jgi:hypothetical protein
MTRHRRERGVTILETAVVAPVLFLFLLAAFEFGLFFRDAMTVADAAADGARVGAVVGPDLDQSSGGNADFVIVKTVREALASLDPYSIERIVVFKGNSAGVGAPLQQMTTSCRNGTASAAHRAGRCNIYEDPVAAFAAVQSGDATYFDCPGSSVSCDYNPETRDDGPQINDIDYLGVYVRLNRGSASGVLGASAIERATVVRLEPGVVE